jgi:hypothetical protein
MGRGEEPEVPMLDDEGSPLTDAQLLDRVQAIGAIVVRRGPVESVDFATWRRELRKAARARGMRLAVNQIGGPVVISNPDHVVTDAQVEHAVQRMNAAAAEVLGPQSVRPRPRRLRVVTDTEGASQHRSPPPV